MVQRVALVSLLWLSFFMPSLRSGAAIRSACVAVSSVCARFASLNACTHTAHRFPSAIGRLYCGFFLPSLRSGAAMRLACAAVRSVCARFASLNACTRTAYRFPSAIGRATNR